MRLRLRLTVDNYCPFCVALLSFVSWKLQRHSPNSKDTLQMESVILPSCRTITSKSPEFPQKLSKDNTSFKNPSRNTTQRIITDAHVNSLCKNGRLSEAIASLELMQCGSAVSSQTLSLLIQSCIDSRSIKLGRKLHGCIKYLLEDLDPFTETKFVGMYAKCGFLEDAYKLFDNMSVRNLYAWSAMIGAFSREKKWGDVVELFYAMMMEDGIVPDEFLFPKILQACGNNGDVETGRLIQGIVIKSGMDFELRVNNAILAVYAKCRCLDLARKFFDSMEVRDTVSWNAMITGYCIGGDIEEAQRLFKSMRERGFEPGLVSWNILISSFSQLGKCDVVLDMIKEMETYGILPDVFTWTSMISGFTQSNLKSQGWEIFAKMIVAGVQPNEITLITLISTCASLKDLKKGRELHAWAVKEGFGDNVLVRNSLVDMYSKCGKLEDARLVFDSFSARDVYTWNSLIGGYCQGGYCGKAYNLFMRMQESEVQPNVVTWNTMIAGYLQNGAEDQAMDLFQKMEKDGHIKPETASWNTLVAGYVQNGNRDRGFQIFRQMQSLPVKSNSFTILSILPACANLIAASKVKEIHCFVLRRNLESELSVSNSLMDAFARSGNIEYSMAIFNGLSGKDIISWNTLIAGFVMHGCPVDAIELFKQMSKTKVVPNRGTYASMISAYGLAGMVDEGKWLFSKMISHYDSWPCLGPYVAMVNLFGRSGKLEEAVEFINNMTIEPNSSMWAALLTASRVHGNTKLALYAVERLLELEPKDAWISRLVLQLYALCGTPEGSLKSYKPKKRKDFEESHGWSWIEDKNTVHLFVGGNCSQQISGTMKSWINHLGIQSRRTGCSNWLPIEEEESEESTGLHSEKLAFAFALSKASGASKCIRVVKNVRMCKGCHDTAKFISSTYCCNIYLNDKKCLHHFRDGHCSCNDYW